MESNTWGQFPSYHSHTVRSSPRELSHKLKTSQATQDSLNWQMQWERQRGTGYTRIGYHVTGTHCQCCCPQIYYRRETIPESYPAFSLRLSTSNMPFCKAKSLSAHAEGHQDMLPDLFAVITQDQKGQDKQNQVHDWRGQGQPLGTERIQETRLTRNKAAKTASHMTIQQPIHRAHGRAKPSYSVMDSFR